MGAAVSSPGGFQLSHEELLKARDAVRGIQDRAAALLTLAADADPEWTIWGVLGSPFAVWYWANATQVYEHLELMGEALASNVRALGDTADAYAGAEESVAAALRSIHQELDDKGAPW
jgi:hypothetical protein